VAGAADPDSARLDNIEPALVEPEVLPTPVRGRSPAPGLLDALSAEAPRVVGARQNLGNRQRAFVS